MTARIIVVDNEHSSRELITSYLHDAGLEVFSYDYFHTSQSALKTLQPDLIVLDFTLKDSGLDWNLLQLLKLDDSTARIPVVITTSLSDLADEIRDYLLANYIQVLQKPFEAASFLALVEQTIRLASQAQDVFSSEHTLPILVVDDSDDLREAITTILEMEGYTVATATNGRLALKAVFHADYSLILLDMSMPVMGGLEFLKLYTQQLRPHIPVIILSGDEMEVSDFPPFVRAIIRKPFDLGKLLRVTKQYAKFA